MSAEVKIGAPKMQGVWAPLPAALGAFLDFLEQTMLGNGILAGPASPENFLRNRLRTETNTRDLSVVPSCLLLAILEDERCENAAALHTDSSAAAVLAKVIDLHREVVAGSVPEHGRWSAIRAVAVRVTEAARDPALAHTFTVVEAACWNPASARSVLVDTARPWLANRGIRAEQASDWPPTENYRVPITVQSSTSGAGSNLCAAIGCRDPNLAHRNAHRLRAGRRAGESAIRDLADLCRCMIDGTLGSLEAKLAVSVRQHANPATTAS